MATARHATRMVTVEIWVMNVLTMPLHLAHLGLHPTTTSSLVGIIILLMQLRVLMVVTTFMRFWNDYDAFGWRLFLSPKLEASIVFIIGSSVSVMRFTHILIVLCFVALSFFSFGCCCFEQAMDILHLHLLNRVLTMISSTKFGSLC